MIRRTRVLSGGAVYLAAATVAIGLAWAGRSVADEATTLQVSQITTAATATTTDTAGEQTSASKPEQLGEVLVTAQKTSERLQDVPISVSALDQSAITSLGITDIEDITRLTPGLDYTVGPGGQQIVSIRGVVSTFGTATTGIYIDDTPIQVRFIGQGETAGNAFPDVFDLERIEVLRGPQGTLFGSGSEGGTLRFITPQPSLTDWSGHARAEFSFLDNGEPGSEFGVAVGGPLIDNTLGFRLSAYNEEDAGWINLVPQQIFGQTQSNANSGNTQVINGALTWAITDSFKITPSLYYQRQYQADIGQYWLGLSNPAAGKYVNGYVFPQPILDRFELPALKVSWNLPGVDIFSNTSFMDRTRNLNQDYTFYVTELLTGMDRPVTPSVAPMQNPQQQFTQEIRAQSADPSSRIRWVVGGFFQRVTQHADQTIESPGLNTLTESIFGATVAQVLGVGLLPGGLSYEGFDETVDKQLAGFGQVDFKLTSQWTLTAGLRYAHTSFEHANLQNGPFNGGLTGATDSGSENDNTPKVGVSYKPNEDSMLYASIAKGFRPGGTNTPIPLTLCASNLAALGLTQAPDTYDPDHVWSYELGSKGDALAHRFQWDASAFYINWSQIQSLVSLPVCGFEFIKNLGSAVSQGFDLQLSSIITQGLILGASVGYTDARYVKTIRGPTASPIVTDGDRLAAAPWHETLSVDYTFWLLSNGASLYAHVDGDYTSSYLTNNPNDALYDPVYNTYHSIFYTAARAGFKFKGWDVSAFAKNVTNSHSDLFDQHWVLPTPLVTQGSLVPRSIGVTATYEF